MTTPDNDASGRNHYDVLGVDRRADAATISKAWRRRTRKAGPGSPEFTRLNDAAETLLNPDKRAVYDATLPVATQDVAGSIEGLPGSVLLTQAGPTVASAVAPTKPGSRSRALWIASISVLTVLAIIAVVLAVIYQGKKSDDDAIATARIEATAAARTAVGVVLGYSWNTMPADLQNDLNYLTPAYAKTFKENFDLLTASKKGVPSAVARTRTIVTASVLGAAVMDAAADRVNVLVFADQTAVHKAGPKKQVCPCVLNDRVKVSMVKQGDKWLIDNLETN